jgi:hypothetical protein
MRLTSGAGLCFSSFVLVVCGIVLCPELSGQNAPSLQEQIKAQYKLVKIGFGPTGITVTNPGTVLSVQKGGLLGVPPQAMAPCAAHFQDGDLKGPTGMCQAMMKQVSRLLQVGDKVYPLKIDVSLDKDRVVFQIVECDSCNGTQQPSFFKSEVVFQFPSGSLQSTGVSQIVDTIGQVLSIDSGDDSQQQGGGQGAQDQGGQEGGNDQQGNNQGGGGGGQQQAASPEPQQIEKCQTPEQVKAALGNPEKIVNLGAKMIYVYKDIKVTFLNGKVSDVE